MRTKPPQTFWQRELDNFRRTGPRLAKLFIKIGTGFAGLGLLAAAWSYWTFYQHSSTAVATVVDVRCTRHGCAPIVAFVTPDTLRWRTDTTTIIPNVHIEDVLAIRYDRRSPPRARVDQLWACWAYALLFGGFAALLCGISAGVWIACRWMDRARHRAEFS